MVWRALSLRRSTTSGAGKRPCASCVIGAYSLTPFCLIKVMLICRYERELASGSRPALRLIIAQDAPSSGPMVLCVSNIFWTDECVDAEGHVVPPHPELEVTDGWYRLRATVDDTLARVARNKRLRIGRKIACSGAKVDVARS